MQISEVLDVNSTSYVIWYSRGQCYNTRPVPNFAVSNTLWVEYNIWYHKWQRKKSKYLGYICKSKILVLILGYYYLLTMFIFTLSSHPDSWKEWNITVLTHVACSYLPLLQRLCGFKMRYSQSGKTSATALNAGLERTSCGQAEEWIEA